MGILTRMFRKKMTEEELAEKSRREKEWAEKCYRRGEEFADRIALDKVVSRVNNFANKYPRSFFGIIIGFLFICIIFNFYIASPTAGISSVIQDVGKIEFVEQNNNPRIEILTEMMIMAENLEELDKKIEIFEAKDTLTRADSLEMLSLLKQAEALNSLLNGRRQQMAEDSTSINK